MYDIAFRPESEQALSSKHHKSATGIEMEAGPAYQKSDLYPSVILVFILEITGTLQYPSFICIVSTIPQKLHMQTAQKNSTLMVITLSSSNKTRTSQGNQCRRANMGSTIFSQDCSHVSALVEATESCSCLNRGDSFWGNPSKSSVSCAASLLALSNRRPLVPSDTSSPMHLYSAAHTGSPHPNMSTTCKMQLSLP